MQEIRIITSNIRFSNPDDNENIWDKRKNYLASTLIDFTPHLIATQEGRQPQILELEALLLDYQLLSSHRPWINERMYPCIFIKKAWAKIIESGDLWLSDTPNMVGSKSFDSTFPRLATWTLLELQNEKKIFIVNTHLDHIDTNTRQKQVTVLLNELANYLGTYPSILTGDFNEGPNGKVRAIINNSHLNLIDPWQALKLKEEGSYHSFKGEAGNKNERIDWILHTNKFKPISIELEKRHQGTIYPSDHYPVNLRMSFT